MQYDVDDMLRVTSGKGDKDKLGAGEIDGFVPPAEPSTSQPNKSDTYT